MGFALTEGRLNVRVPSDLVRRLAALMPKAAGLPECELLGTMDHSKVARVALRGIVALEHEVALRQAGKPALFVIA